MSTNFVFPKPRDWQSFEDIVCDIYARRYNNPNLQRYGRSGQAQHGVDIAGIVDGRVIGIQCKHHPAGNISTAEIDKEIDKSERFAPGLNEFVIVTSADRDATTTSHVLAVSQARKSSGEYPVTIVFWQDVYNWLADIPDLMYKHFTRYFPIRESANIRLSREHGTRARTTLGWPFSSGELRDAVIGNIGGLDKASPYTLALGVTTFVDVRFEGVVDVEIQLTNLFSDESSAAEHFNDAADVLKRFKEMVREPYYSSELWVHERARLSAAFLIGWTFRRVTGFHLRILSESDVWPTQDLPLVSSGIRDGLPVLISPESNEVVVVLNISRDIDVSVFDFVEQWDDQPRAILSYHLDGYRVSGAAHALSIAIEISGKMKTVIDRWQMRKIHLFGALPAPLATLIAYGLNAICPISIYFRDATRTTYLVGGTLVNSL